ncbi:putative D-isomer specific 2-hydroxyacid dehydrogenase [Rosellinia necatrix]|uniref:Putative D-isomer specific 2-hydroxyacid dehydrogenase n=1 Tax=Rosellinia necatrix TaxID=77044 RepID=A0A1W2TKS4_ROSNE|nr:putative D-isomer specific 2-hydroxyacid dehydrogenase [Rosellinia necatrix]
MGNMLPERIPEAAASSSMVAARNKDLTGHKLLIIADQDLPDGYREHLREKFPGLEFVHLRIKPWAYATGPLPGQMDEDWANVTILLTGIRLPAIAEAPKLQLVQLSTAGVNYVLDKPIFKDTKIPFCTANGVAGPPIAEWVICTYLAYQHRIPRYLDNMKKGLWEHSWDDMDTLDVVKQRVGILGYGSIGRQVARVATAMGMEVYAYTNRARPTPESRRDRSYHPPGLGDPSGALPARWFSGTSEAELGAFLGSGLDLLVAALPLTPQTRGLLGRAQFERLAASRPGGRAAYLCNVGRGATVVTDDLIAALDAGWVRGAALDVTDPEPLPPDHPLWKHKDVIVTPHVSGNSDSYYERLLEILDVNLERLSEGKDEFLNEVSRKRGY